MLASDGDLRPRIVYGGRLSSNRQRVKLHSDENCPRSRPRARRRRKAECDEGIIFIGRDALR